MKLLGNALYGITRLKDEESLLTKELPGYEAYKQKIKYRPMPYIW